MKRFLFTIGIIILGTSVIAEQPKVKTEEVQLRTAQKVKLKKPSCKPPKPYSLRNWGRRITFTLKNGDIGTCKGDDRRKKSFNPPAPYAERVEASSYYKVKGQRYLFSGLFHFDPEASSSSWTTFFLVHQWHSTKCRCSPYVRISWGEDGSLYASVLKRPTKPQVYKLGDWRRSDFEDKWVEVAIDIDTSKTQSLSIYVGGKHELTTNYLARDGGTVFLKTGLYRPGNTTKPLPTDRVSVRYLRASVLKQNSN